MQTALFVPEPSPSDDPIYDDQNDGEDDDSDFARCSTCDGQGWLAAYGCGDQAGGWADTCQECKGRGSVDPDPIPASEPELRAVVVSTAIPIRTIASHPNGSGFYISPFRWNDPIYALTHPTADGDWRFIGAPGWFVTEENKRIYEFLAEIEDFDRWHFGEFVAVDLSFDPDPADPQPWDGPKRTTAFSILLQPCGSCGDAIPVLGPRVCAVCFDAGYCPVCGEKHSLRLMCPEVRRVWLEQEAIERAAPAVEKWLAEDWQRDRAARAWSQSLLGAA